MFFIIISIIKLNYFILIEETSNILSCKIIYIIKKVGYYSKKFTYYSKSFFNYTLNKYNN